LEKRGPGEEGAYTNRSEQLFSARKARRAVVGGKKKLGGEEALRTFPRYTFVELNQEENWGKRQKGVGLFLVRTGLGSWGSPDVRRIPWEIGSVMCTIGKKRSSWGFKKPIRKDRKGEMKKFRDNTKAFCRTLTNIDPSKKKLNEGGFGKHWKRGRHQGRGFNIYEPKNADWDSELEDLGRVGGRLGEEKKRRHGV